MSREHYRENLNRGLRLGHEITLEDEDGDAGERHLAVTYRTEPLRKRQLRVNAPQVGQGRR